MFSYFIEIIGSVCKDVYDSVVYNNEKLELFYCLIIEDWLVKYLGRIVNDYMC